MKEELKKAIEDSNRDLKNDIGNIHSRLNEIEDENNKLKRENEYLKERMKSLEEYSRKDNILINGLEREENETDEVLIEKVKGLGVSLGVPIEDYDIHACHRLPTGKKDECPTTIVKLNNRHKQMKLIRRSKVVRLQGVYVSPHLPKQSIEINKEARRGMKEGRWKFAWINANQQVLIRKDEKSPAIKIRSVEQLKELEERFKKEEDTGKIQTRAMANKTIEAGNTSSGMNRKNNKT